MTNRRRYSRRKTDEVRIGGVVIGGENKIAIQSMTNTDTKDVRSTAAQINELAMCGADIVRVAVPGMADAAAIGDIKKEISVPLVADIHYNYKLALECIKQGIDKIRINPGNIGCRERVARVAEAAGERGIPIRIGVNGGSLEQRLIEKYGGVTPDALVESALSQVDMLRQCGFCDIVVSIKASDIFLTVDACVLFAQKAPKIAQHIGMTEAGTFISGTVKSSIGMYELLREGIGDTLRVSLTGDPVNEVIAARTLLMTAAAARSSVWGSNEPEGVWGGDERKGEVGVEVISCPTCARCKYDLAAAAAKVELLAAKLRTNKHIRVAVMGCQVNGPGEARSADIGVAGMGDGRVLLFMRGEPKRCIPESEIVRTLALELEKMVILNN